MAEHAIGQSKEIIRMVQSILKHPYSIAVHMAVAVLLAGCSSVASSRDVPVPVLPLGQDDLIGPAQVLRGTRRYRECVAAAKGEDAHLERCLDGEIAGLQRSVEYVFNDLASRLDGDALAALHAGQREWQREMDENCAGVMGDGTSRAHGKACRADGMIRRFLDLSHQRSRIDASYWSEAQPDETGALEMALDDASVALQAQACDGETTRVICSDVHLTVTIPGRAPQTLALAQAVLPRRDDPLRPAETGVRGTLKSGFSQGVYGISLTDLNVDGHEDLMVWTGFDGTYGDPSYTYFIFDPAAGRLVENTAIAEAMMWHSLSRVVDGQLFAWYRSGPCERGEKTIDVRGAAPVIVERRDYNTCTSEPQ